ncbi:MAG: hypothetical protein LBG80_03980 [Bacteroidales bacterium]|jgi:hypothetical protein|nr:hypothetical protein [Bacteroidales bacterium]
MKRLEILCIFFVFSIFFEILLTSELFLKRQYLSPQIFPSITLGDSCNSGATEIAKDANGRPITACIQLSASECQVKLKRKKITSSNGNGDTYVNEENGCATATKKIQGACTLKTNMKVIENEPGDQVLGPANCGQYTEFGCQDGETESKTVTATWTKKEIGPVWVDGSLTLGVIETIIETQEHTYEGKSCNPKPTGLSKGCGGEYTASSSAPC